MGVLNTLFKKLVYLHTMLMFLMALLLVSTCGQHLRLVKRGGRRLSLGNAHNGTNIHIRLEIEEPTRIAISEIGGRQTAFDIGVLSKTSDGNVSFVQNSDALHTFMDSSGLSIMELSVDQCIAEILGEGIIDFECPMIFNDGSEFAGVMDHVACSGGNCAELGVYEVSVLNASLPAICVTMKDMTGPNAHSSGCDSARDSTLDLIDQAYCQGTASNMDPSNPDYNPNLADDRDFYQTCCEWTGSDCVEKYESVDTSDTSMAFVSQCDTDADYHSFENLCVLDSCHRCALSFTCEDTPGTHGQCVSCPDGQDTRDAMNQFVTEGATQCLPCSYGKHQTGSLECQSCVAGSQTQNVNGTYVSSGATNCEECSFGKYNAGGSGVCTACTDGTMTLSGTYSDFTYVTSGANLCRGCPYGKVSQNNAECSDCPDGTGTFRVGSTGNLIASTGGGHVCSLCSGGKYSRRFSTGPMPYTNNGTAVLAYQLRCMLCGDGREITNGTGNGYHPYEREFGEVYTDLGATDCSECAAGYWRASGTMTQCVACEPGHEIVFVSGLPTSCTTCSVGKYSMDHTCLDCLDGSQTQNASNVFVTSKATLCTPCAIGKYQTGDSECQACEDGYSTIGDTVEYVKIGDFDGLLPGDQAGGSVSLATSTKRVAVGSPASNLNGTDRGHVRVFDYQSGAWSQVGQTIIGEMPGDFSGCSVQLNKNGDVLAIGAHGNSGEYGNETRIGHVRIFDLTNSLWVQRGLDIDGEVAQDGSGLAIDCPSGDIIAIGSPGANGGKGHVRVFEWHTGTWTQKGQAIEGLTPGENSGYSVSIVQDPDLVLAIGAVGTDANGLDSGAARIYTFSNGIWGLVKEIKGEYPGDASGWSVDLQDGGYTDVLAIGAIHNDGNGQSSGHVRVYYRWGGSTYPNLNDWLPKGQDIIGDSSGDLSGYSIALSGNGERLFVGAIMNDGTDANGIKVDSGHVRSYFWSTAADAWILQTNNIGESSGDFSGASIATNYHGSTVAIGSVGHDGNGVEAGQVRVFDRYYEYNVYVTMEATACTACAIGHYQSGTDECQQCPAGSQTLNETNSPVTIAASQCVACEAGKFQTGNDACQVCEDGSDTRKDDGQFVNISGTQCVQCTEGKETLTEVSQCTFIDCALHPYKCADSSTGTCGAIGAVNCQGQCVNSIQYHSALHSCPIMYASFELHHNPDAATPLSESDKCGSAVANTTETCIQWRGHLTNNFGPTSVQTLADQDSTICRQLQTIHEQNEVKEATPTCVPYFSVIAPIYVYPHNWNGTHNNMAPEWVLFIETAKAYPRVHFHVIINPSNGADSLVAPNLSWADLIQQLKQLSNVRLYGYVPTGYGSTNVSSTVTQYIQGYASNWQIQDIFLDEMNGADAQGQDTMQTYSNYGNEIAGDSLCNFGSPSDSAGNPYSIDVMFLCTQSILLENTVSQLEHYVLAPAQESEYGSISAVNSDGGIPDGKVLRDRFSAILHTSGTQPSFDAILDNAFARVFGSIYLTPGTGGNPYQQMLQSDEYIEFIKKIDEWSITHYISRN